MFLEVCNLLVSVPDIGEDTEQLQSEDTSGSETVQTVTEPEQIEPEQTELTEYQAQMLEYTKVTTETVVKMYGLLFFILGFLIFDFFYRLIKYNVTNHM